MDIILSGYNVDCTVLSEISNQEIVTPETISAAYARISRSKDSVTTLRKKSLLEVEKSRNSNQTIIFEMGHSSIAEHAVFNFDIIGVSRYLSEWIQKSRLASFTEKSQRYVTLNGDFVIPEEINKSNTKEEFVAVVKKLTDLYSELFELGKAHLQKIGFDGAKRELFGKAKEDARYVLPLATETQMGMTINARSLEKLLRRLDKLGLVEADKIHDALEQQVKKIAPSLVKYTKTDSYESKKITLPNFDPKINIDEPKLIHYTKDADEKIISALIFEQNGGDIHDILQYVKTLSHSQLLEIYEDIFSEMKSYHAVPKAFELVDVEFEISMSSSCFAQLKRHRLATILKTNYSPKFGYVIPPLLISMGAEDKISNIMKDVHNLYYKLEDIKSGLGNYILTNGHKLNVIFKANLREMYHFSRLRSDSHAQWEIREISKKIDKILKETFPLSAKYLAGKDEFSQLQKA